MWFINIFFISDEDDQLIDDEQMKMFLIISEQCLPKLVCELHAKAHGATFSESEKSLMALIGYNLSKQLLNQREGYSTFFKAYKYEFMIYKVLFS